MFECPADRCLAVSGGRGRFPSDEIQAMKLLLKACLLALPLLAIPAEARAHGGCKICFGVSWSEWNPCCDNGCGGGTLAPWYTYWPYAAHFQVPAAPSFPFWPAPMTTSFAAPPAPPITPAAYSPVGGYPTWPSYWYGH